MIIKLVAALVFAVGVAAGAAGIAALSPDNFGALTQMIGEPVSNTGSASTKKAGVTISTP